jgi:hypothetical protein
MLMVITSFPRWSKTQQVRLNTLVKFEPAEPLFGGQFSTGANRPRACCAIASRLTKTLSSML